MLGAVGALQVARDLVARHVYCDIGVDVSKRLDTVFG